MPFDFLHNRYEEIFALSSYCFRAAGAVKTCFDSILVGVTVSESCAGTCQGATRAPWSSYSTGIRAPSCCVTNETVVRDVLVSAMT